MSSVRAIECAILEYVNVPIIVTKTTSTSADAAIAQKHVLVRKSYLDIGALEIL